MSIKNTTFLHEPGLSQTSSSPLTSPDLHPCHDLKFCTQWNLYFPLPFFPDTERFLCHFLSPNGEVELRPTEHPVVTLLCSELHGKGLHIQSGAPPPLGCPKCSSLPPITPLAPHFTTPGFTTHTWVLTCTIFNHEQLTGFSFVST